MNWKTTAGFVLLVASLCIFAYHLVFGLLLALVGLLLVVAGICQQQEDAVSSSKSSHTESSCSPSSRKNQCKPANATLNNNSIPSSYIVFDIETTGLSRSDDRIIEIAATAYKNGLVAGKFHTYVNPGVHIPITITRLTGIRDTDVENAPAINDVKRDFLSFIGSTPLVGHNIQTFDIPFLEAQFHTTIYNKVYDTLRIAKKVFPGLPSYKLTYLDQALHLGGLEHHRAENDIAVNNALFVACSTPWKYQHLLTQSALSKIEIDPPATPYSSVSISSISQSNSGKAKCTGLTGKTIAFTGEILTPRKDAVQMAVDAGAVLKSGVSRNLDYLVVGEQNARVVGESGMSTKQLKAIELIEAGNSRLQIINEGEFLSLLNEIAVI